MEKVNTKKYVYVVSITWNDSLTGLTNVVSVFKSESKARENYIEQRKFILQNWKIENIDLNEITNKLHIKENYFLEDYTNRLNIEYIAGKLYNTVQLKIKKVELE